jgi:hypothetical protein
LPGLIWLLAWDRVSDRVRSAVLFFTALAAIGATFLALNLHLANGATHPWLLPGDAFDEGIDLDSVLLAIQVVIAAVNIILLRRLRRKVEGGVTPSVATTAGHEFRGDPRPPACPGLGILYTSGRVRLAGSGRRRHHAYANRTLAGGWTRSTPRATNRRLSTWLIR